MKKQFSYESAGGGTIVATSWEPEGKTIGVVQIIHGIAEHVARYEDFASYLNGLGYTVVAEDHMGHGASVGKNGQLGYFSGGWWAAVEDTCCLMRMTMQKYPDIPYVLFGHSMGSFMARSILAKYPDSGISGCIICGTGWQEKTVLRAGRVLANMICKLQDPQLPSAVLHNVAFGAYNKRVERPRTASDWLTRDTAVVDAYVADPLCGFQASAGLMRDMFEGIAYIQTPEALCGMNKTLPVYFIAGGDDPVGNYGKGVRKTAQAFREAGMERVQTKIYPLDRHEILNEINKLDVYRAVANWLQTATEKT